MASHPYQPYTGGFTGDQSTAFQNIGALAGSADQNFQSANSALGSAQGAYNSAMTPAYQNVQSYMNPYVQNVINSTMANMQEMNGQQQQQVIGNAISKGAMGGNRVGVAQSELARQQNLANQQTISGLWNDAYSNALGAAQNQQQIGMTGASGLAGVGNAYAGLGNTQMNTNLTQAAAQLGAGTQQQQFNYQQYLNQQAFPYQQYSWLSSVLNGTGPNAGGTTTQTSPGGNIFSSLLGAGLGVASLFGDGGVVRGYADGGKVPYDKGTRTHEWPTMDIFGTPYENDNAIWMPYINPEPTDPARANFPELDENFGKSDDDYGVSEATMRKGASALGGLFKPKTLHAGYNLASGGVVRQGYDGGGTVFNEITTPDDAAKFYAAFVGDGGLNTPLASHFTTTQPSSGAGQSLSQYKPSSGNSLLMGPDADNDNYSAIHNLQAGWNAVTGGGNAGVVPQGPTKRSVPTVDIRAKTANGYDNVGESTPWGQYDDFMSDPVNAPRTMAQMRQQQVAHAGLLQPKANNSGSSLYAGILRPEGGLVGDSPFLAYGDTGKPNTALTEINKQAKNIPKARPVNPNDFPIDSDIPSNLATVNAPRVTPKAQPRPVAANGNAGVLGRMLGWNNGSNAFQRIGNGLGSVFAGGSNSGGGGGGGSIPMDHIMPSSATRFLNESGVSTANKTAGEQANDMKKEMGMYASGGSTHAAGNDKQSQSSRASDMAGALESMAKSAGMGVTGGVAGGNYRGSGAVVGAGMERVGGSGNGRSYPMNRTPPMQPTYYDAPKRMQPTYYDAPKSMQGQNGLFDHQSFYNYDPMAMHPTGTGFENHVTDAFSKGQVSDNIINRLSEPGYMGLVRSIMGRGLSDAMGFAKGGTAKKSSNDDFYAGIIKPEGGLIGDAQIPPPVMMPEVTAPQVTEPMAYATPDDSGMNTPPSLTPPPFQDIPYDSTAYGNDNSGVVPYSGGTQFQTVSDPRYSQNIGDAFRSLGEGNGLNLSPDFKQAMLAAGMGMMASRSPFALQGIGEGGLKGIDVWNARQEALRDDAKARAEIAQKGQELSTTAAQTKANLGLTQAQGGAQRFTFTPAPGGLMVTDVFNADKGAKFYPFGSLLPDGTVATQDGNEQASTSLFPSVAPRVAMDPLLMNKDTAQISLDATKKTLDGAYTEQQSSQNQQQQLTEMQHALDELPEQGWLSQGAGFNARLDYAKKLQAAANVVGVPIPDDIVKQIAAGEDLAKVTTRLGFELSKTLGSDNAASIVESSVGAVPGGGNSKAGAQRLINALAAVNHRRIDYFNFMQSWATNNNGSLRGADTYFNQHFPPERYALSAYVPKDAMELLVQHPEYAAAFNKKYGNGKNVAQYVIGR